MKLKKKLKKILALGMTLAMFFPSVTGSIPIGVAETSEETNEPDTGLSDGDFEPLEDETDYGDSICFFNGIVTLEGKDVTGNIGNEPNPYASELKSEVKAIYGLNDTSFDGNGKSNAVNSSAYTAEYGTGGSEQCAGTAHHAIDYAFIKYFGDSSKKPFKDSGYYSDNHPDDGLTYFNINTVSYNDLRALQKFADNNGMKITIQDSAKSSTITFNDGDIIYWLNDPKVSGSPSNNYTELCDGNGRFTATSNSGMTWQHVNVVYEVGTTYITILNNSGGSSNNIYLKKATPTNGYWLGDGLTIRPQANGYANRILVVHFEKSEIKYPVTIKKNGGTATFPTATYKNGKKTGNGTIPLSDIASKYDGYGLLSDARFTAKDASGKNITVYTDKDCTMEAKNGDLKADTVYYVLGDGECDITVYETTAPKGWSKETDGKTKTLSENETTEFTFTDKFSGDPLSLYLTKKGKATEKIKDAKFTVTCNETGEKWTYVTDENGFIDFGSLSYLYDTNGGNAYINGDGDVQFFLGTYTIKESEPASGYLAKGEYNIDGIEEGAFDGSDDIIATFDVVIDDADAGTSKTSIDNVFLTNATELDIEETPAMMGFEVQKVYKNTSNNTILGDMTDYTTKFKLQYVGKGDSGDDSKALVDYSNGKFTDTVTYNKGDYIYAPNGNTKSDSLIWTTDSKGNFKSGNHLLQVGTYKIVEATPPKGFIMWSGNDRFELYFPGNSANSTEWQNVSDGYICLMQADEGIGNTEIRGGIGGFKYDEDTLLNSAANGSTFDGIEFWVRNDSLYDVYLDTDADGIGDTLLKVGDSYKFYTLQNGKAEYFTNPTFLGYGTYSIYEKKGTNTNYIIDETKEIKITIRQDLDYILLCKNETDAEAVKNSINAEYSNLINALKNSFSDGVSKQIAREINYKLLGTDLDSFFANKVARHGVAIIKYDADDYINASTTMDVINGDSYPEAQGDATLIGAKYQIINRNGGVIYIDTDNDHMGDEEIAEGGVCIEITTSVDKTTGVEYACTPKTLLPNGTYEIVEVVPPRGYLVGSDTLAKHSYTSTSDGQYFLYGSSDDALAKLKDIVNNNYPKTVYGNHTHTVNWVENKTDAFADPVIRGQLSIEKHDADRIDKNVAGTQGDAAFEDAVYEIYNISDHYVYTKGVNGGTSVTRYETGKETFKALTGIDTDSSYFEDNINKTFLSKVIYSDTLEDIRNQMSDNVCYTLSLDEDGKATTDVDALPYGTYLIIEKTPSEGYLNSTIRNGEVAKIFRIRENNEVVDMTYDYNDLEKSLYEPVIRGGFEVYKYDEETRMNIPLGGGSLAASFEVINRSDSYVWVDSNGDNVYSDDECYEPGEVVYTFTTDALIGKFTSDKDLLPYGTYEIHETYPPEGYLHLSYINPNMSVFFEIREEGKIVKDGWFYDKDGNKVTTATHYAPLNVYVKDGTRIPNDEMLEEREEVTDSRLIIYNQVIRGDLFFEKKSAISMKAMPYIPFLMSSYDENGNIVEQHVIFTDQNGGFNTSALYVDHTYETNSGDELYNWLAEYEKAYENKDEAALELLDVEYKDLVKKYKNGVGTWFGLNSEINDELGALPFGTYTIEELRCPNNAGYDMVSDTIIVSVNSGETNAITDPEGYKNHTMYGTINFGTIYNTLHGLSTVALTQDEQSHYSYAYSDLVIIDTVSYENVVVGRKYKLIAELHDQETGNILYDAFGEVTKVEKEFVPDLSTGSIAMNIDYDASAYKDGGAIVVYEYLYDITDSEDGILVMREDNPNEAEQTIYFPRITSELISEGSELHLEKAKDGIVLADTIYYENLEPNKTYVIEGYLIDKDEIDYAKDDYGNHIIADIYDFDDKRLSYDGNNEIIFKPTERNGSFKLSYKFDGTTAKNKAYVSFIEVKKNRNTISTHMDIEDTLQTVYFPEIGTKAYDSKTKNNISFAENNIRIIDVIKYSNVYPNVEYTVESKLYNKETGEFVCDKDGNEVVITSTITPTSENGEVEVELIFDGLSLEGTTLVAFETLYYADYEIADHKDKDDKEQTVYIPKIRTKARDSINATQIVNPDGTVSITDTITYNNLLPSDYIAKGYIMDADTNELLLDKDGNEIVEEQKFTAESSNGEADVTFTFDGYEELKGKTIVVFEELYIAANEKDAVNTETDADDFDETDDNFDNLEENDFEELEDSSDETSENTPNEEEVLVKIAEHKDIEDREQTIYFPELHTTAYDKQVRLNITKAGNSTIIDTVSYYNLPKDLEYTVKGTVMDGETGEAVIVNGEEITAVQTFKAENTYGTVDVVFEFDTTELSGKTLVVYEELCIGEFVVAQHKDINDKKQTIYVPKIGTNAKDKETNTNISYADNEAIIIDTVSYNNLIPGKQYLLVAQLMDGTTNEAVYLTNGTEFDADTLEHLEDIDIAVSDKIKDDDNSEAINNSDTSTEDDTNDNIATDEDVLDETDDGIDPDLKEDDFEDLIISEAIDELGNEILEGLEEPDISFDDIDNEDINNENTSEDDKENSEDKGFVENATDSDASKDENVTIGEEASEGTGVVITDEEANKNITSNGGYYVLRYFTPMESNGTVDMTFIFDTTGFEGKYTVAFEEVYVNGISIAEHKDINDKNQTIIFPKVETTATNKADGTHYAEANGEITIVDTVRYSNLVVGKEYMVNGTLMVQETGNPLYEDMCNEGSELVNESDRNPISATKTFVAETSDGSIDLEFTFNASLLHGKTVVVFEDLYLDKIKIATHADITDEEQSVHLVKIGTVAVDKNTKTHTATVGKTTFIDTVEYEGLVPGQEYVISGKLMDGTLGKSLTVGNDETVFATLIDNIFGKSNEFIGEIKFTPTESSGSVEIKFDINTTNLKGKTVVVYEKLYHNGKQIASHEDLEDKNQTIEIPDTHDTPDIPRTGVDSIAKPILSVMALLGGIGMIVLRRRRKRLI